MYTTLQEYDKNTICPISHDIVSLLHTSMKNRQERICRGMGIDCLFYIDPEWNVKDMNRQREKIEKIPYDPETPYAYQFSPSYAEYPYDVEYTDEFGDSNKYLPSFISSDSTSRVEYH